jgi:hypothetical protein
MKGQVEPGGIMNSVSGTMHPSAQVSTTSERLTTLERVALIAPFLGGLVFGILPLLFSKEFAAATGNTGNDVYLYRLTGAVVLGYAPGLLVGILRGEWTPLRLVIIATLVFNLGSLFAIGVAFVSGITSPFVFAILVASLLFIAITVWLLNKHQGAARPAADTAEWVKYLLYILTAAAFGTGILFLLAPLQVGRLFGFTGMDEFVFRQGGAATLGFAVMGVYELRSRAWREIQLPSLNAMLFNGASLIATILAIFAGDPLWLLLVVLPVALVATLGSFLVLARRGK